MIWVVLLILAFIAYFGYKGLHSRHVARCRYDERTHEHVPESISDKSEHKAFHEKNAAISAQASDMPAERVPAQRGGPSLLYAERAEQPTADPQNADALLSNDVDAGSNDNLNSGQSNKQSNNQSNDSRNDVATGGVSSSLDTTNETTSDLGEKASTKDQWQEKTTDSMDFTAETATLSSDEVGTPANSSDYDAIEPDKIDDEITLNKNADTVHASVDTDQASQNIVDSAQSSAYANNSTADNSHTGIAAAGVAAAAAGIGIASAQQHSSSHDNAISHESAQHNQHAQQVVASDLSTNATQQVPQPTTGFSEGIDLELGDSTHNEPNADIDENDELLDFGDLTADISEMLKELNLREGDSPRLEINQDEFAQLKTGEPGEVKHEKIENVAGKLRNMLQ